MRRSVVNAAIDESRRPWRRERKVGAATDLPVVEEQRPAGIDDRIADREVLVTALRRIPPRQRAVLVLRYFEDLDVAETADVMGCSQGTVKSQAARGLSALRAQLGEALGEFRPSAGGGPIAREVAGDDR